MQIANSKYIDWTDKCSNQDCKDPRQFQVTVTSGTVVLMYCPGCKTHYVLRANHENPPRLEFKPGHLN